MNGIFEKGAQITNKALDTIKDIEICQIDQNTNVKINKIKEKGEESVKKYEAKKGQL